MLALLALLTLGQSLGPCGPEGPVFCNAGTLPFFEFAPSNGSGMGAACAGTTPTGSKGEVLTFTRASSATCLTGGTVTGIANGSMVTLTNNQPRVMPGGNGAAPNGLLVEDTRTNYALRSQEFENAAWPTDTAGGAGAPTVTANFGTAPDGTSTADRLQVAACPGAPALSGIYQLVIRAATMSSSVFIKGNGTSGDISIGQYDLIAVAGTATTVAFNATTWTRATLTRTNANANVRFYIGCLNFGAPMPGSDTGAADVLIWGGDDEDGSFASSYIATAGAGVTRANENANFPSTTAFVSAGSAAASIYGVNFAGMGAIGRGIVATNVSGRQLYIDGTTRQVSVYDGTNDIKLAIGSYSETVLNRFNSDWSGSTINVRNATDVTSASGAFDSTMAGGNLYIGTEATGLLGSFVVVKQVCVDPSPTRCR